MLSRYGAVPVNENVLSVVILSELIFNELVMLNVVAIPVCQLVVKALYLYPVRVWLWSSTKSVEDEDGVAETTALCGGLL